MGRRKKIPKELRGELALAEETCAEVPRQGPQRGAWRSGWLAGRWGLTMDTCPYAVTARRTARTGFRAAWREGFHAGKNGTRSLFPRLAVRILVCRWRGVIHVHNGHLQDCRLEVLRGPYGTSDHLVVADAARLERVAKMLKRKAVYPDWLKTDRAFARQLLERGKVVELLP